MMRRLPWMAFHVRSRRRAQTMRKALDAPRYDAVRTMLSEFDGAPFIEYASRRRRRSSSTRRRRLPGPSRRQHALLLRAPFSLTIFQRACE